MSGRLPPMLGGPVCERELQNARVKKSPADLCCVPTRVPMLASPTAPTASSRPHAHSCVGPVAARGRFARADRAAGFTLIEVLIALIVLVLGVLGAAAMTLSSLKDTKQSGLRSQATMFAYEMSDIMRANAPQYSTTTPPVLQVDTEAVFTGSAPAPVSACYDTGGCSRVQMAQNDYAAWSAKLTGSGGLPNGAAKICRDSHNVATTAAGFSTCDNNATSPLVVKLKWDEINNNARDATTKTAATTQYLMVVIQPY
jgi:type IV pilus assembly protein PilV